MRFLLVAGALAVACSTARPYSLHGGAVEPKPVVLASSAWPEKPQLLATLDGSALVAARAAMWDLTDLFVKNDKRFAGHCDYSPKAMDVVIREAEGMYVVRINPRVDRCKPAAAVFNDVLDPALYAVSPVGKILIRYPYVHEVPLVRKPLIVDGIRWPEESRLLATLDGRAIAAAHAAVQDLNERFALRGLKFFGRCDASPRAMDVLIFEGEGTYIVRINPRVDRCEGADPSFNAALGSALFAVSPEGKVLARVLGAP